jgi:peptidylprolyl isomerase
MAIRTLLVAACAALLPAQDSKPASKPSGIPEDQDMKTTASGLFYSVLKAGEGKVAKAGDRVKVHYTGWLTDGTKFDSSRDRGEPFDFVLGQGQVIKGWDEGVALMSPGARFKLTIAPELGYGERAMGAIPPKSTLVFDVELLEVAAIPEFVKPDASKQKTTESGLKYEVLKEGSGDALPKEDGFEMRYAFWTAEGKLLGCSEQMGQKITGTAGTMTLDFLKEAVPMLRQGSCLRLEVPARLAWGDKPPMPDLAPGAVTIWELELVKVIDLPEFVLPAADKLKKTDSGLQYEVLKEGSGQKPAASASVTVHYVGWLTDGKLFDASYFRGQPVTFSLGNVIKGWSEGVQLMSPGAVYRLVIPPDLGYGEQGAGSAIPPKATLVFQIELVKG